MLGLDRVGNEHRFANIRTTRYSERPLTAPLAVRVRNRRAAPGT